MKRLKIRYSRKRIFAGLFLFLCIFGIGIGYALVNTDLDILGVATMTDAKWDVHFDNYVLDDGSVVPETNPTTADTSISFSATASIPGEFYGFTIDVVNEGTIDAAISSFTLTPDFSDIAYIDTAITYMDGTPVGIGDALPAGRSRKIKVLLEYKDGLDAGVYPSVSQSYNVSLSLGYEQYTGKNASFETDSWEDIIVAYELGKISNLELDMRNGVTREVSLDLDHDGTSETTANVRIANLSKPSECSSNGFSQTACGLVLEFVELIDEHRVNQYDLGASVDGDGNKGGWESSEMRAYLNGSTYTIANIDYSGVGVIDALPIELKNLVIDTTVVSGYGSQDNANFTTTDKLYLLSTHEVWEDDDNDLESGIDYFDTSYDSTRQLDYYALQNITIANHSLAKKRDLSGVARNCRLRSVRKDVSDSFIFIGDDGYWYASSANYAVGFAPLFRIAE